MCESFLRHQQLTYSQDTANAGLKEETTEGLLWLKKGKSFLIIPASPNRPGCLEGSTLSGKGLEQQNALMLIEGVGQNGPLEISSNSKT